MVLSVDHFELVERLSGCASLQDAAQILDGWARNEGFKAIVYGYMVLGDADAEPLMAMTLPRELREIYEDTGGARDDPVAERLPSITQTQVWDIEAMRNAPALAAYRNHPFLEAVLDMRFDFACLTPILARNGVVSVFAYAEGGGRVERRDNASRAVDGAMAAAAGLFHECVRAKGMARQEFRLTVKELDALKFSALGDSARDLADRWQITERAVEKRLASVRRKLGARTTANAVYRAMAFGLL